MRSDREDWQSSMLPLVKVLGVGYSVLEHRELPDEALAFEVLNERLAEVQELCEREGTSMAGTTRKSSRNSPTPQEFYREFFESRGGKSIAEVSDEHHKLCEERTAKRESHLKSWSEVDPAGYAKYLVLMSGSQWLDEIEQPLKISFKREPTPG
jgi:hypothetical protein